MFEALRKMIMPIIIIVLFFFVAMIVLQWGMGISSRNQFQYSNMAGVINGEEISWEAFSRVYSNLLDNERASKGADYDITDERSRQLEEEAWNQLVTDRLLRQAARDMNVVVTDEDVYLYLKNSPPAFLRQEPSLQTNGQFDYNKYMALMQDPQAASLWAQIEPMVRDDIERIRVQQHVMEAAHVTEGEVRQAFMNSNERIQVSAILASYDNFSSLVPDPDDEVLRTYLAEHGEDFPVGERVVLDIVKIAKDPSAFDTAEAKVTIQMIYDSVTTGSDFAEFAKIYSDDPGSGAKGGDLGWFKKGRMVKEFDSAAFAMKEGDVSIPIKTNFGYHILWHQGYRGEGEDREAHVSHILVKPKASDETLTAAWDRLEDLRTRAEEIGLDSAALEDGLESFTTNGIERKGYVAYLKSGAPVLDWAFEVKKGDISEVMDLPSNYAVVRVADHVPAGTADFEQVKVMVKQAYRNDKLKVICHDTAQQVYALIQNGQNPKTSADRFGLPYEDLPTFARGASVSRLANDPVAIGTAFSLKEPGEVSAPVDYSRGTVIFQLVTLSQPDLTAYNEARDSLFTVLLDSKKQQAFSAWYTNFSDEADVQSNFSFRRR